MISAVFIHFEALFSKSSLTLGTLLSYLFSDPNYH